MGASRLHNSRTLGTGILCSCFEQRFNFKLNITTKNDNIFI